MAAFALEKCINSDHSDHSHHVLPCPCGSLAIYAGRRPKSFKSVLGTITISRAYYHCSDCQAGFCPRDHALGLHGSSLTPGVTRMVGHVGAMVSFQEGQHLMSELSGVHLSTKQVERTAEMLGRHIAEDERSCVTPPQSTEQFAETMYLGMDGTGVPIRHEELINRKGKQPDGSAKTREVKLVTVWTAESRDKQGRPVRDPGSISYSAAIESVAMRDTDTIPSLFAQRVLREATRRGFDQVKRRVVLGDGAVWIWNLVDEHWPDAIQIVDLYHAKEHLWNVAKAIYGAESELRIKWATLRHEELEQGKVEDVLSALKVHINTNEDAKKCHGYFTRHKERMKYPEYRAKGLCVGSGVVEAGCKTAVGVRCKRAGMHWTVSGADAIIALRCSHLNGRFEDFWERCSTKKNIAA